MSAPIRTLPNQHSTASAGSTPLGAARRRDHRSLHDHSLSYPRPCRDLTPGHQPADTLHRISMNVIVPEIHFRERGVPLQRACNSYTPDFSKTIVPKIQCRERGVPLQRACNSCTPDFSKTIVPKVQCRERGVPLQRACNSYTPDFFKTIAPKIQCRERGVPLQRARNSYIKVVSKTLAS